jgi:hypothetical protein
VTLRAARENIKREVPLNSMLIPTRVPIIQGVLIGHVLQIMTARIKVTIPSKTNQPVPGSGRSMKPKINSKIASKNRQIASAIVSDIKPANGCMSRYTPMKM